MPTSALRDRDAARETATCRCSTTQPVLLGVVETIDQWTLTNSLNLHRPLYRFGLDDDGGTELYVSAKTGEMVMRTTRNERLWSWLGTIIHWGAPRILRERVGVWRQTMLWLSGAGMVLVSNGISSLSW